MNACFEVQRNAMPMADESAWKLVCPPPIGKAEALLVEMDAIRAAFFGKRPIGGLSIHVQHLWQPRCTLACDQRYGVIGDCFRAEPGKEWQYGRGSDKFPHIS